jgi:hypothetical protein
MCLKYTIKKGYIMQNSSDTGKTRESDIPPTTGEKGSLAQLRKDHYRFSPREGTSAQRALQEQDQGAKEKLQFEFQNFKLSCRNLKAYIDSDPGENDEIGQLDTIVKTFQKEIKRSVNILYNAKNSNTALEAKKISEAMQDLRTVAENYRGSLNVAETIAKEFDRLDQEWKNQRQATTRPDVPSSSSKKGKDRASNEQQTQWQIEYDEQTAHRLQLQEGTSHHVPDSESHHEQPSRPNRTQQELEDLAQAYINAGNHKSLSEDRRETITRHPFSKQELATIRTYFESAVNKGDISMDEKRNLSRIVQRQSETGKATAKRYENKDEAKKIRKQYDKNRIFVQVSKIPGVGILNFGTSSRHTQEEGELK